MRDQPSRPPLISVDRWLVKIGNFRPLPGLIRMPDYCADMSAREFGRDRRHSRLLARHRPPDRQRPDQAGHHAPPDMGPMAASALTLQEF